MSGHTFHADATRALALGHSLILNPGTGNTLDLENKNGGVAILSAGTYALPTPLAVGFHFYVVATGSVTLTGAASLSTGQAALIVADSASSWGGHVLPATGDDFATLLAAELAPQSGSVDSSDIVLGDTADVQTGYGALLGVDVYDAVAGALTNIVTHLFSTQGFWEGVPLPTFREVDSNGDVGTTAASGGVLASNTTPIYRGETTTEAQAIHWTAADEDPIATTVGLPPNLDGAADLFVDLVVQANNTNNAPSFSVLSNFDGGSQITDTATGTSISTIQTITATIGAGDVPNSASTLSLQLVPGTHASDSFTLFGVRIRGKVTRLTS